MVNLVLLKVIEPIDDVKWDLTVSDEEEIPSWSARLQNLNFLYCLPFLIPNPGFSQFLWWEKKQNNNNKQTPQTQYLKESVEMPQRELRAT